MTTQITERQGTAMYSLNQQYQTKPTILSLSSWWYPNDPSSWINVGRRNLKCKNIFEAPPNHFWIREHLKNLPCCWVGRWLPDSFRIRFKLELHLRACKIFQLQMILLLPRFFSCFPFSQLPSLLRWPAAPHIISLLHCELSWMTVIQSLQSESEQ